MSYSPTTDFLALLRQTAGGVRSVRMPGLDYVVKALARAGLFQLYVGQTPPTANQTATVWLVPALQSWTAESAVFLWDASAGAYAPATPALWSSLFSASLAPQIQDITTAGPVPILVGAGIVRVQAVGAPVALTMPLSANKVGPVLITDWANHAGTNAITVSTSGGEVFPGGGTTWQIGADAGSVFLRPVPGGFAL